MVPGDDKTAASRPIGPAPGSDAYFQAASAVLATAPSGFDTERLGALLSRHYGLSGRVTVLSSEVEQTAEVELPDGQRLILKTSAQTEAVDSFRFQSAALAAVEGAAGFRAPRLVRTAAGTPMIREDGLAGYLQTRVDGVPLYQSAGTADLLYLNGRALAALDRALAGRDLPAMHRPVLWHIGCWPRLIGLCHHLPPGSVADSVARAMAEYSETIEPRLGELDWQVTHNDPSPFNTLATDHAIAFIDFGDGGWGPRIQDLAIAASHVVSDPAHPLGGAEHLIAGYSSVLPLSAPEVSLLVGLMRARQSALILINYWRAALFPADAAYIKKNVARAETGLAILASLDADAARSAVLRAAGAS